MTEAVWSDELCLNVAAMDEIHHEFVTTLAALRAAADGADFLAALDAMLAHCQEHFAQETLWMDAVNFPPMHCHVEEHDKVLTIMGDVRKRVESGDIALGRNLARELMPWLEHHAATMDTMLAKYIQQQGYDAQRLPKDQLPAPAQ